MTNAITIPDDAWQPMPAEADGGDGSCLLATIVVNGCSMHLEAHAVRIEDGHVQADDGANSEFERLHAAHDCEGHLETVTIRGREYVLFAHAYGD